MFEKKIVASIDLGTNFFKMLVAQKNNQNKFEILVQSSGSSRGLRKGAVDDIGEVASLIREEVEKAEKTCDRKIKSASINIGGNHLYVTSSHGLISVSRSDQKISEQDVERVIQEAQAVNLPSNYQVLDVFPLEFIVDDQKGIKEPIGLSGIRLEARVLLLCTFSPVYKKLSQAVLEAGLEIDDIIPSSLAAAKVVLTKQQKESGVALVDIGAETTQMAVFEEGILIHFAVFPIGSSNITNDIAIGLRTDISTAETIKKEHGSCILDRKKKSKKKKDIEVKDKSDSTIKFSEKMLVKIIEARVGEIFDQVKKELKKISRNELLPGGVILTGGGVKLPKIDEFAKEEFKLPSKIGIPRGMVGLEKDTSFTTAVGLILDSEEETKEERFSFFDKIKKMLKKIMP